MVKLIAHKAAEESGSFFVEMMVSLTVLLIFLVGLVPLVAYSVATKVQNHQKSIATYIVNRELERARSTPYDSIGIPGGNPPGTLVPDRDEVVSGLSLHIRNRVWWSSNETDTANPIADPTAYKIVSVSVLRNSDGKLLASASTSISREGEKPVGSGAHLKVVARRQDGTRLENATASIVSGPGSGAITYPIVGYTDDKGEVLFADLEPSQVDGDYSVTASLNGYVVRPDQLIQTTTMHYNEMRVLEFILELPGRLFVRLLDPSGALIDKQSEITLNNPLTGLKSFRSNDGSFTIPDLFPGDYQVSAKAASYEPTPSPYTAVISASTDTYLDITLQPKAHGNLHLEVFDASNGARIVPDDVKVTNQSDGSVQHFSTNANGVLETQLEVGTYTVEVSKNGYTPYNDAVTITASGNSMLYVNLVRTPTTGSIAVRTEQRDGTPRNGVWIQVTGPGGYTQTAWTGYSTDPETGKTVPGEAFFGDLQPGTYTVKRYSLGWRFPRKVTVIAGQRSKVVYTY